MNSASYLIRILIDKKSATPYQYYISYETFPLTKNT